jgi:photosystem II stability/assembly factor-like uncharacterized protein
MLYSKNTIVILFWAAITSTFAQQPASPLVASFSSYKEMKAITPYGIVWISLGPAVNSARAESVQAHPSEPGTMYAAFGSGSLWKTTNNGLSWRPIFNEMPSLGIGDIAIAPSNPSIIYVGTGESLRKARNFTMPGTGIYRSNDAGATWTHLGLNDSWHIGEIAVHPENPDIVVVSVLGHFWSANPNRGIYRTEDGGITWQHVLYINETTAANDVVFSPSDANYLYASMWEFKSEVRGDMAANNMGKNSGVYTSKDGGRSWKKAITGLPEGDKIGRISVAVSYSNPLKAYVLIDNQGNKRMETGELYNTIDGGSTWHKTHKQPLRIFSVVGWYFTDIYVSPDNDDEVYGLGVRVAHSSDGGRTFAYVEGDITHINASAAQGLHLDHCELWINPANASHLILANDGGVYSSYDKGKTWLHYNNIPTGEFYDITLDSASPYNIYGGVQDDATVYGPSKEFSQSFPDPWKYLWIDPWNGGDGCVTQVDPDDINIVYYSTQEGSARRLDRQTGKSLSIKPKLDEASQIELKFNFITPYFISPHDAKTLYHAGNVVFKSKDRGDNWQRISEDLSLSKTKRKSTAAGALVESKRQAGLLYLGTDNGVFWVSRDDGKNWQEQSAGLPGAYIRSISPSNFSTQRVYIALTGLNYDDLNSYVYVSENYGKDWQSITANLPNEPMNVVVEDPTNEDILYVGSHRGVYISYNRGSTWAYLGKEMPAASVADIEIDNTSGDMIVATHGRGIYKVNLNELRALTNHDRQEDKLFTPSAGRLPVFVDIGNKVDYSSITKSPFSFWLNAAKEVTLSIDSDSATVWKKSIAGQAGLNQYRWNLITEHIQNDMPYFIHYEKFIAAGEYRLILMVGEERYEKPFTVIEKINQSNNDQE